MKTRWQILCRAQDDRDEQTGWAGVRRSWPNLMIRSAPVRGGILIILASDSGGTLPIGDEDINRAVGWTAKALVRRREEAIGDELGTCCIPLAKARHCAEATLPVRAA